MTDLILVPTSRELETLRSQITMSGEHEISREHDWDEEQDGFAFQLCGFGCIAAAARTGALISRYKPRRVLLIGIAGSFDVDRFAVGTACRFDEVACTGIGVGSGNDHRSARELGWHQFGGGDAQPEIGDLIELDSAFVGGVPSAGRLLTCCAASANLQEASDRMRRFPNAVAEDMEGFGVAMACSLARIPLQIVRGISNRVGDRDHANWRIEEALTAAAEMANRLMPRVWMPRPS